MTRSTPMTRFLTYRSAILGAAVVALGMALSAPAQAQLVAENPSAKFLEARMEHNAEQDGERGIRFLFKIQVTNAKGRDMRLAVLFLNKNNQPLNAVDTRYSTPTGHMAAWAGFRPIGDNILLKGSIFVPYSALVASGTPPGEYIVRTAYVVCDINSPQSRPAGLMQDQFKLTVGGAG